MPSPSDGLTVPTYPAPAILTPESVEQYGKECVSVGVYNERAAVMLELDKLARHFEAQSRPNTAKAIREAMGRIDARLRP